MKLFSSAVGFFALVACANTAGCGSRSDAAAATSAQTSASIAPTLAPPSSSASSSASTPAAAPETSWLESTLVASDPRFVEWFAAAKELRLQILVTEVDPLASGWTAHEYRVDAEYFYPASAIKTLLAIAALRVLDARSGGEFPLASRIERCRVNRPRCEPPEVDVDEDATKEARAADPEAKPRYKKLRVGEEITKLLSYSDNDSYNRLWDIVGQEEVNREMSAMGFTSVRFHHRMDTPADGSRATTRVLLLPPSKKGLDIPARKSSLDLEPTPAGDLEIGSAYFDRGKKIESPMGFERKNYVSLRELQLTNLSLLYPERAEAKKLGLSDAERAHLVKAMTATLAGPAAADHHPISGGVLEARKAERIRIVSKSGRAYGFHIDNSLVLDVSTKKGFFVTATVYSNPDGVLNDDDYGYKETTRPLLRALGKALASKLLPE